MKKLVIEFAVLFSLFFLTWFLLAKIDWMGILHVEKITRNTEERIGDLFYDSMKRSEIEISSVSVVSPVDTILGIICAKNHIDKTKILVHLIRKDEINAFALPNHHIVVYSGLIEACENEAELCGVLCHEMAHLEKGHVMNKLVKDVGLSMLISISTGKGNPEIIQEAIRQLSSTAYDRNLENEADRTAIQYLMNAHIDPLPFANFLFRLSDKDKLSHQFYWISTHPESKERSERIISYLENKSVLKETVIGDTNWELLKRVLKENNN